METAPGHLVPVAGDVADVAHRRALSTRPQALGPLGLLVNNASGLGPSPLPCLAGYPLDALGELFEVNVVAPLALVQEALPALRRRHGTVVNITSDAGVEGYPGLGRLRRHQGRARAALPGAGRRGARGRVYAGPR